MAGEDGRIGPEAESRGEKGAGAKALVICYFYGTTEKAAEKRDDLCAEERKNVPQGLKAERFRWVYVRAKARTYLSRPLK